MKRLLLAALIPVAMAQAECVMTDRVTTAVNVRIEERSDVRKDIVPSPNAGYRRCQVSYKARINARWYLAMGAYDWPGDTARQFQRRQDTELIRLMKQDMDAGLI